MTAKDIPKSAAIKLRRYSDDLSVYEIHVKIEPDDQASLGLASAKAKQAVRALEHAAFNQRDIGEGKKAFTADALEHYIDDTEVAAAMAAVREHLGSDKKLRSIVAPGGLA